MSNMPKTTKRQVSVKLDIETCVAVEKKYGKEGDKSKSVAYIRALEEASRGVELTSDDIKLIAAEVAKNELKRKESHK